MKDHGKQGNDSHRHEHHHHGKSEGPVKAHGGHGHHGGHDHKAMLADFRLRFWISLALSVPVVALSPMIQGWLGYSFTFTGAQYLVLALSSAIFFYGGWPFHKGLFRELRDRSPGMMTLIALAISVAYFYSTATVLGLPGKDFFWELATLIDVMLVGHWIEMRSVMGASRALELLVEMMPATAHLVDGEDVRDVKIDELKKGDLILVRPGEKIPADGVVKSGESEVNAALVTGESKPVRKKKGDEVIGGTINGNSALRIEVAHTGEDSYLNKVVRMVKEAQETKSKTQHLADRAAKYLTYIAIGAGGVTLAVWLVQGFEFVVALERMVTVMVITCPHALGLAIPLVVAISTSRSASNGLLIRNRTAFENARKLTAIVFDKTGTLTKGEFGVSRVVVVKEGMKEDELLRLAGALEQNSEHPLAVGIMEKLKEKNIESPETTDFKAITGKGVQAVVEGKNVKVVSPGFLRENDIEIPEDAFGNEVETVVFVVVEEALAGYIALADEIRPESRDAIRTLKKNGIKVLMATGDNKVVAKAVSEALDLDGYYAEVLPEGKVDIVKELQEAGEFVAMTGDGINDAPALATADVGIAVGSGTDVAAETADIILVHSNPADITGLILFGKATYRKMVQNLIWATAYNIVAIPLAAGVLWTFGIMLSPAVGAVFMSLSTVIVAANSQLLKLSMGAPNGENG